MTPDEQKTIDRLIGAVNLAYNSSGRLFWRGFLWGLGRGLGALKKPRHYCHRESLFIEFSRFHIDLYGGGLWSRFTPARSSSNKSPAPLLLGSIHNCTQKTTPQPAGHCRTQLGRNPASSRSRRRVAGGPSAEKLRVGPGQGTHRYPNYWINQHNARRRGGLGRGELTDPAVRERRGRSKRRRYDGEGRQGGQKKAFHREPPKFLCCREHWLSARGSSRVHSMLILPLKQGTLRTQKFSIFDWILGLKYAKIRQW